MHTKRTDWNDLPVRLKDAIETKAGPVRRAVTVRDGQNSALAAVLETEERAIFAKGMPCAEPGVAAQGREVAVGPYVAAVSPRLLWHVQDGGWDVLVYEYVHGRGADYAVGSRDLWALSDVMRQLGAGECPQLPELKRTEVRWRRYLDDPKHAGELAGTTLLHTDWNPANVLITDDGARLIDWSWPTLGAAWIDPACWILRLVAAGHSTRLDWRGALGGKRAGLAHSQQDATRRLRGRERSPVGRDRGF